MTALALKVRSVRTGLRREGEQLTVGCPKVQFIVKDCGASYAEHPSV